MRRVLSAGAVFLVLLGLLVPAARSQGRVPTFDEMMARFARVPGMQARFREEKRIALLAVPLVSEGTVHFMPPRRLARVVTSPARSSIVLDGTQLTMRDGARVERIDLAQQPLVEQLVSAFVDLLAGDARSLRARFEVQLEAREDGHFELALRPREARLGRLVQRVEARGHGVVIEQLVVTEASGDVSRTTYSDVDVQHRYADAEAARVFGVPGR